MSILDALVITTLVLFYVSIGYTFFRGSKIWAILTFVSVFMLPSGNDGFIRFPFPFGFVNEHPYLFMFFMVSVGLLTTPLRERLKVKQPSSQSAPRPVLGGSALSVAPRATSGIPVGNIVAHTPLISETHAVTVAQVAAQQGSEASISPARTIPLPPVPPPTFVPESLSEYEKNSISRTCRITPLPRPPQDPTHIVMSVPLIKQNGQLLTVDPICDRLDLHRKFRLISYLDGRGAYAVQNQLVDASSTKLLFSPSLRELRRKGAVVEAVELLEVRTQFPPIERIERIGPGDYRAVMMPRAEKLPPHSLYSQDGGRAYVYVPNPTSGAPLPLLGLSLGEYELLSNEDREVLDFRLSESERLEVAQCDDRLRAEAIERENRPPQETTEERRDREWQETRDLYDRYGWMLD